VRAFSWLAAGGVLPFVCAGAFEALTADLARAGTTRVPPAHLLGYRGGARIPDEPPSADGTTQPLRREPIERETIEEYIEQ